MPELRRCLPQLSRRLFGAALFLGIAGCAQPVDAPPVSVVFFTSFSTVLGSEAQSVIDRIAEDAKASPRRDINIQGFSDRTSTTPAQSRTIAEQRAQVVADGLVAKGVDRASILLRPRRGTLADPGIESRRVDISFAS